MERLHFLQQIKSSFKTFPMIALLGPRQCGKMTLANQYKNRLSKGIQIHFFDLEKPTDLARLENPQLALEELDGLIIIDEIQRRPELFTVLRFLIDRKKRKVKYLILGSASIELIKQSSESLTIYHSIEILFILKVNTFPTIFATCSDSSLESLYASFLIFLLI